MAKKDLTNNPALSFLSGFTEKENENKEVLTPQQPATAPQETVKKVRQPKKTALELTKREGKSERLELRIKPSTYDKLKAKKEDSGLSVNEIVNQILENYL